MCLSPNLSPSGNRLIVRQQRANHNIDCVVHLQFLFVNIYWKNPLLTGWLGAQSPVINYRRNSSDVRFGQEVTDLEYSCYWPEL